MRSGGDLVDLFMEYTRDIATNDLFRKWSGITMVAGAMERRIYAQYGPHLPRPHLYVMLMGSPGSGKDVIRYVRELWSGTKNEFGGQAFHCGMDDTTKAALIDKLHKARQTHMKTNYQYNCVLLPIREFSVTFPKFDQDLLSFFSAVWDAPDDYIQERRTSANIVIKNPIITALMGYQPALLHEMMSKHAGKQGFLRRTILVSGNKIEKKPLWNAAPMNKETRDYICRRLGEIYLLCGEMKWEPDAQEFLSDWQLSGCSPTPTHPDLISYNESRHELVLRLCITASMSENTDMVITLSHAQRALDWLIEVERQMESVFEDVVVDSDWDIIKSFYTAMLKEQNIRPITDVWISQWLAKKVSQQKHRPIMESMLRSEYIVKRDNGTWRATGKGP